MNQNFLNFFFKQKGKKAKSNFAKKCPNKFYLQFFYSNKKIFYKAG